MSLFRRPDQPVSRKQTRGPGEIATLVLIVLAVTTPVILSLWQRGELLRYGYEIENLKQERDSLAELKRKLLVERSSRQSLPLVEKIARRDLGLVEPSSNQVHIINDDGLMR